MSLSKSESDVILNRANVALSRSQRLVASWLPQQTNEELANTKTDEELQREEDEIFTAVPETLVSIEQYPLPLCAQETNKTNADSASEPPSPKKQPTEAGTGPSWTRMINCANNSSARTMIVL
jgi:hypothetical protein